jgi:hypothetical protein
MIAIAYSIKYSFCQVVAEIKIRFLLVGWVIGQLIKGIIFQLNSQLPTIDQVKSQKSKVKSFIKIK